MDKPSHQPDSPWYRDTCRKQFTSEWEVRITFPTYGPTDHPWEPEDPARSVFYIEVPDDQWTAVYGLTIKDGAITVAEMRIHPTDTPGMYVTDPGEWSRNEAEIPKGGLTTSILRRFHVPDVWRHMPEIMSRLNEELGKDRFLTLFRSRGIPKEVIEALSPSSTTGGEPNSRLVLLARIAKAYTDELAQGNLHYASPLAQRFNYSKATIRTYVSQARKEGLLTTPPARRQPGGELTELADALLAQADRDGER